MPLQILGKFQDADDFEIRKNMQCYADMYGVIPIGENITKGYKRFILAMAACKHDVNCAAIYDYNCDYKNEFFLCPKFPPQIESYDSNNRGRSASCVYQKRNVGMWSFICFYLTNYIRFKKHTQGYAL